MARPKKPKDLKETDRITDADSQTPSSPERTYEIGYGKPPKHTRFKRGQSGNPRGPRAGTKSFKTLIERELDSTIMIKVEGGVRKATKREAAAIQFVNALVKGDPKAIKTLIDFFDGGSAVQNAAREPQLDERSRRVLEQVLAQASHHGASTGTEGGQLSAADAGQTIPNTEAENASVPAPPKEAESNAATDASVRSNGEGAGDG